MKEAFSKEDVSHADRSMDSRLLHSQNMYETSVNVKTTAW